jgi:branched-subunit amino acid transport protein AzlD
MPHGMQMILLVLGGMAATTLPFMYLGERFDSKVLSGIGIYLFVAEFLLLVLYSCGASDVGLYEYVRSR